MKTRASVIAIDAMGGDVGLDVTLNAVALAQSQHDDVCFILVGREEEIRAHQAFSKLDAALITIVHAEQVVAMDESPSSVLRHKTQSSMWKAIELVRDGQADACVSAGNTGALMASARYLLKMLPGISRPAICATVPNRGGHVHWLDLGANVDSKAEQLVQFAVMGSELAKAVDGEKQPRVGLLNIGEEAIKGNEVVKETHKLLSQSALDLGVNYIGFVEGNDIFMKEQLDVVVCDGFAGNVALKTAEGVAKFLQHSVKQAVKQSFLAKCLGGLTYLLLKPTLKSMDPRSYNGASLLGLQGIVVKSHGNADVTAYANAIRIAKLETKHQVIARIKEQLQNRVVGV
ncbi:MAG: phosphate acyltransferase PlsX [Cardiobacteriaceae bacterium]|nr:phosphate acyltransferase PlsX [Cardiobacteriaceae bacterium]